VRCTASVLLLREREKHSALRGLGDGLLAIGMTVSQVRVIVADLFDMRRRRDKVMVDIDGTSVPWEIASCFRDEQTRHMLYCVPRSQIEDAHTIEDIAIAPEIAAMHVESASAPTHEDDLARIGIAA
jgi:hypothetical protein